MKRSNLRQCCSWKGNEIWKEGKLTMIMTLTEKSNSPNQCWWQFWLVLDPMWSWSRECWASRHLLACSQLCPGILVEIVKLDVSTSSGALSVKRILPQKIFYRQNLIFCIVMGCGKLVLVGRAKNPPKTENFGLKVFPLDHEATCIWDLKATRDETSRQPARTLSQPGIGPRGNPHRPRGRKGGYRSAGSSSFASLGVV